MKKNTFIQGAFIATFGIILSKILGIIYVIPFYSIIGDQGGALYGYAYSIYGIFLGISQAGIPLAISKVISEYNVLGYYDTKERAFKLGKKTLNTLGIICFLIMFIFAKPIAYVIMGNITGGNTIEDITFVIRVISTAILVVPILSIYRGYLQGHKFITPTSVSQVLEQLVRVVIIVGGSFLTLRVFNLSLKTTVGIAVFSATLGALTAYLYLLFKAKANKDKLNKRILEVDEPKITDKEIINKILIYAFPFIMIDVFRSLINSVDIFMLVRLLVDGAGYTVVQAETVMSIVSTWGLKLNMIVIAIGTGLMISLIPNLTSSFVKEEMDDVRKKINQTLQCLFFFVIPMSFGLSVLAKPVWTVFYGASELGPSVYGYYVFVALATTMFTSSITILQLLKEYKKVIMVLLSGLITKIALNVPLLFSFHQLGFPAYYGSITATIIGYIVCASLALSYIKKKYQVNYEETIKRVFSIVTTTMFMVIILLLLEKLVPFASPRRLINILYIVGYGLIGAGIYFVIVFRTKLVFDIFGKNNVEKALNKLLRRWFNGICST